MEMEKINETTNECENSEENKLVLLGQSLDICHLEQK